MVVGAAWVMAHLIDGRPVDEMAWIILAATSLRVVTIAIALSSVPRWDAGSRRQWSSPGWFNLAMAWLILGVPGALFVAAARSYRNRRRVRGVRPVLGLLAGTLALFGIG